MSLVDYTVAPRLERPETWTQQAACAETDPAIWFPANNRESPEAIAICDQCPVRQECLDHAISLGELTYGIRGGLYPRERRQLVRGEAVDREPTCRHCHKPLGRTGASRFYHPDCHAEYRATARRAISKGKTLDRTCLHCGIAVAPRKHFCPECLEVRRKAQLRANSRKQNAKKWRQCSWCGLNTKAKDGLHPECAEKRARALDGLEVGQ